MLIRSVRALIFHVALPVVALVTPGYQHQWLLLIHVAIESGVVVLSIGEALVALIRYFRWNTS